MAKNLMYTGDKSSNFDEDRHTKQFNQKKKGNGKSPGESLNRRSTMTRLTRMEAMQRMTVTISTTGRRVKAIAARRATADGCPSEIRIPTRAVFRETSPPHYWNVWTSQVAVVISIGVVAKVVRECAGAGSGSRAR